MKRVIIISLVAGVVAAGAAGLLVVGGKGQDGLVNAATAPRYHCAMHPGYVSEKPGDCPICGMKLVPMEAGHEGLTAEANAAVQGTTSAEAAGRATFTLSPERRQMLGLRSETVRRAALERTIRTVGRVAVDERRLHHIHTKFEAYVEDLNVDFTGKFVRKGEPLLSLYSPELVATQQEYLLAHRAHKQLGESALPQVARGGIDLLDAARQRLLLCDIRPMDIESLERTGEVRRTLALHSPVSGYVMARMAYQGMRVTSADTLFDVADLSHLWVMADVYESDLPLVCLGMYAELTVPYLPGKTWRGTVTYVAPTVDEKTRTIKVRVEVDNSGESLKPEMFANVLLRATGASGLVVPESAVVHAGERQLVFLDREGGRLEPHDVELGTKTGAGVHVLRGLAEGDRVVTSANFLLDSESSLKATVAALATTAPVPAAPTAGGGQ